MQLTMVELLCLIRMFVPTAAVRSSCPIARVWTRREQPSASYLARCFPKIRRMTSSASTSKLRP
jgi:hypothetical protein